MDITEQVQRIAQNVLRRLEAGLVAATVSEPPSSMGLFRSLTSSPPPTTPASHPANIVFPEAEYVGDIVQFLGEKRCVIEPDKQCVNSGRCKNLGP